MREKTHQCELFFGQESLVWKYSFCPLCNLFESWSGVMPVWCRMIIRYQCLLNLTAFSPRPIFLVWILFIRRFCDAEKMEKETNEPNHGNGFIKAKVKWPRINLMQVKAFSWFFSLFRLMHWIVIQQCVPIRIKQMTSDHNWSNHNSFHLNCLQSFTKRFLIYRINFFSLL